jgi:hypothetical protein
MSEVPRKPLFSTHSTPTSQGVPRNGWTPPDWEMLHDQRCIALREGDTITISGDSVKVWWFTADVRPVERIVTARTIITDQRREADLPFDRVEPLELETLDERAEANFYRRRLQLVTHEITLTPQQEILMRASLAKPLRDHLMVEESAWHREGCECDWCSTRSQQRRAA